MNYTKNTKLFNEIEAAIIESGLDAAWSALFNNPEGEPTIKNGIAGLDYFHLDHIKHVPGEKIVFYDRGVSTGSHNYDGSFTVMPVYAED